MSLRIGGINEDLTFIKIYGIIKWEIFIYISLLGLITPRWGVIYAQAAGRLDRKGKTIIFEFHNIVRDSPSVEDTTSKNQFIV